jgi:hypothetical protein
VLRPGGRMALVEFHPAAMMLGEDLRPAWPYRSGGRPIALPDGIEDYVAGSGEGLTHGAEYQPGVEHFRNPHPAYEFAWGVGDAATALIDAGLTLETLREWGYSNGWAPWPAMRAEGRRRLPPHGTPDVPLMFGLSARRGPG